MSWDVLKQISRVIRECKKQGVETSICGQAGSKEEMVKFLIKQGIDSISVNADVAKPISELIQKLETTLGAAKPPINPQSEASTNSPSPNPPQPTPEPPKPKIELQEKPKGLQEEIEQLENKYNNKEITKPKSDIEIIESDDNPKKEDIFN